MSRGRRVHVTTLGCRLNEAEAQDWSRRFQEAGMRVVDDGQPADLVVVNTCAVTMEAARKSRRLLRRHQRANPGAHLVVSGCLASLEQAPMAPSQGIDLIVPNHDKDRLVELALEHLRIPAMPELAANDADGALFARGRQRAFIKVQDGCRYQCSFCITTLARGAERSRAPERVIDVIKRLVARGIQEVVLTGVHLGGYGSDLDTDLASLIARILHETEVRRLRLGSVEPWGLQEPFWRLFENPRLMPHLHLPLQSGSDSVLRRMARRCKTTQFKQLLERARASVPSMNFTTDIIVGFPGERDEDWQQTLAFVESMGFGHIHAFAYSPRPGTAAATLPNQVPGPVRRERLASLLTLSSRLKRDILSKQVGRSASVLCEGDPASEPSATRFGYTPEYFPVQVHAPGADLSTNQIIEVELTGVDTTQGVLLGRRPAS